MSVSFLRRPILTNQRPAFGEFEVKKILDLPKNSKMKKEQVAKKILKTVQNWNNPRKNISGAGAGIQLWVLRNFFKNFRSRKRLLKKQHKGTSNVVIFFLWFLIFKFFSHFLIFFFSIFGIFFIFGIFLGFPGNPGIFQSHGIFLGF